MKRRIFALILATVMTVSLVGCGSSGEQSTTTEGTTTKSETTVEESTPVVEGDNALTVWCWDPAFNLYAMEQAAEVYKKDHPDFVLNIVETPWADIQTKLTTAATSGNLDTLPDIFLMQDNAFQKNVISFPDAFADITNSGIAFDQFGSAKVAYSVVDGKNYGVPFDNGAVVACYRTDILEQAGYTIDDFTDITWSDYIKQGKEVLAKTGKPLIAMQAGESDLLMMMLQSAGAS